MESSLKKYSPIYPFIIFSVLFFQYSYTLFQMYEEDVLNFGVIFVSSASYATFIIFLTYITKYRFLRFSIIVSTGVFLFSNIIYYRYFESPLYLGNIYSVKNIPFVWDYVFKLLENKDTIFALTFIISAIIIIFDRYVIKKRILITVLICYLILTSTRYYGSTITIYRLRGDIISALNETLFRFRLQDRRLVTLGFGFLPPLLIDAYQLFLSGRDFGPTPDYTPNSKAEIWKPNIILIQVESLPAKVIGLKFQGLEVSPFLNSLKVEADLFTSIRPQHSAGGGTSDADFSTLTSLVPMRDMPSLYARGIERLITLPKVMKLFNYSSVAYHANNGGYYGRALGYEKLGFDQFLTQKKLPSPPEGLTYLPDHLLFDFAIGHMRNLDKPVFSFLITISSHGDYDKLKYVPLEYRKYQKNDEYKNFISAIQYVDLSIEHFINKIKYEYKDYLVIIYGDHPPNLKKIGLKGNEDVPLIILSSRKFSDKLSSTHGSHLDIPATVLSLLEISKPKTWSGHTLLEHM